MMNPCPKLRLAVLISGGGTTLRNLLEWIVADQMAAEIVAVISSNPQSVGLKLAEHHGITSKTITTQQYPETVKFSCEIFDVCDTLRADYVICAGFLKRLAIPASFKNRVINIHPALIPAFCGAGMYGHHVHSAVLAAGAKLSGCTVHFVDDHYDHGPIIAQRGVPVLADDNPRSLAARVFAQECELYPTVINWLAAGRVQVHQQRVTIR